MGASRPRPGSFGAGVRSMSDPYPYSSTAIDVNKDTGIPVSASEVKFEAKSEDEGEDEDVEEDGARPYLALHSRLLLFEVWVAGLLAHLQDLS